MFQEEVRTANELRHGFVLCNIDCVITGKDQPSVGSQRLVGQIPAFAQYRTGLVAQREEEPAWQFRKTRITGQCIIQRLGQRLEVRRERRSQDVAHPLVGSAREKPGGFDPLDECLWQRVRQRAQLQVRAAGHLEYRCPKLPCQRHQFGQGGDPDPAAGKAQSHQCAIARHVRAQHARAAVTAGRSGSGGHRTSLRRSRCAHPTDMAAAAMSDVWAGRGPGLKTWVSSVDRCASPAALRKSTPHGGDRVGYAALQ